MKEWKVLQKGEIFQERYRIESVLGVGGFAHVYRAVQLDLDREVALKVLRPPSAQLPDGGDAVTTWVERFRREAKVISRLKDPHTITMYDYGHTGTGISYMVFEYVAGDSLDRILEQEQVFAPARVVFILEQALQSVHEAHSQGILHRDLKPANILVYEHLGRSDRVKVLDFGIAKPMREDNKLTNADLTREGSILGTPRYMAPEQLKGEDVGPASDLYSLGLVTYELLTGQKAITGDTTMTAISQQLSPDPITLPERLEIPQGLRSIVDCLLAKDIEQRYPDAEEVLIDLERWEADEPVAPVDATIAIELANADSPAGPQESSPPKNNTAPVSPPPNQSAPPNHLQQGPQTSPKANSPDIKIAAAAAAFVIISGMAVFFVFLEADSDTATDEQASETQPQPSPEESIAEQEEPDDEPDLGDEADKDSITVTTDPDDIEISIHAPGDDSTVQWEGVSPAVIEVDELDFPVEITASYDGYSSIEMVEEPTEKLTLVVDPPAEEPSPPGSEPSRQPSPSAAPPTPQEDDDSPPPAAEAESPPPSQEDPPPSPEEEDDSPSEPSPFVPLD